MHVRVALIATGAHWFLGRSSCWCTVLRQTVVKVQRSAPMNEANSGLMAFQFHYSQPTLCNIVVFVLLFFVLVIGVKAGSVLGWHLHERTMICHTRH